MKNIYLIVLLLVSINIFTIEFNNYDMEQVKEYTVTQDENSTEGFDIPRGSGDIGSPNPYFLGKQLVVSDHYNKRTVYLDNEYNISEIFNNKFIYANRFYIFNNYVLGEATFSFSIAKDNLMISDILTISHDIESVLLRAKSYFYHSNILFVHANDGKLWSIKNPGLDANKNKANLLNQEDTRALFAESGNIDGLTIDSENRLFLKGELKTVNYNTYTTYVASKNRGIAGTIKGFDYTYDLLAKFKYQSFIGSDIDKNIYWSSDRTILIYNKNGQLIESFRFDSNKSSTKPTVSPAGDIYFMEINIDNIKLHKINRKW